MPGKHAPKAPTSYYLSLARSVGGALAIVAMVVIVAVIAINSGGGGKPAARQTSSPTPSPTPSEPAPIESSEPSTSPEPSGAVTPPTPTISATPSPQTPDPGPTTLPPDQVSVEVLNGTRRAGLAGKTADRLRQEGYKVVRTGNANPAEKSTILYVPGASDEAAALQLEFPEFTVVKRGRASQPVILRLIIGADFP